MKFNYAIFDLDGTLLDSTHLWLKVDEIFFKKRGFEVPNDYSDKVAHFSQKETALYTKKILGIDDEIDSIINEWNELIKEEYEKNVELKDFAKEYLETLKKKSVKMAIATGLPHALLIPAIKRLGIYDYFSEICSVDDVGKGKGSPELYIYTAKRLGARVEDCIVFEDVLNAMKVAKSTGMKVCAVYDKQSNDYEEIKKYSDYYIKSWKDLI